MGELSLRIVTPECVLFDDSVDMLIIRTQDGDMGIMPGHEPVAAALAYGIIRAAKGDKEELFSVFGGIAEISGERVTILSDAAERTERIDKARAIAAKERAEATLREQTETVDIKKASLALRRALVRIEASSYPLIGGRTKR